MKLASKPGFLLVAQRECRWLLRDRVALLLIFGVPLFAFIVLTTVFSHPVIRGLGVTVVDEDKSDASRWRWWNMSRRLRACISSTAPARSPRP